MISIIIPAYNEEKYIAATIQAVMGIEYPDYEIIVVNNASTDRTAEIASQFPVRVFTEKNKGTQWARERGRLEAQGDILAYLDADCRPDKDWLTKGVIWFSNPKVVAVTGPYDYYDARPFFRYLFLYFQKTVYFGFSELLQAFHLGGTIIGGNFLIRADALATIGGLDTSIVFYGDDTDTAKRISKAGKIVWSNALTMKTSNRRFKNQGLLKTFFLYAFYFFKFNFSPKHKPGNK
jgi:glycosyltransferase involved in cell wall biosynthesis